MYQLRYRITNLAPLVISAKFGDKNMVTTERYIPGTSVLGLLAKQVITKKTLSDKAHEDKNFHKWFLAGNLKISNAYVVSKDKRGKETFHYPIPLSIQKEKKGEQIYDLLHVDDEDFEEQTRSINQFCKLDEDMIHLKDVETTINFHHARNRDTGVSEEGRIFNYEAISPNQTFRGEILGSETDLQNLANACEKKQWTAYIGRSRNAQYGKVRFELTDESPVPYQEPEADWDDEEISLTLLSDTIIYNESGFSTTDANVLQNLLGVEIKNAFIRKGEVENFVGVWGLKKPSETCFLAGSAFLLKISEDDKTRLSEFQKNGIGERTHEGFGKCRFGWQVKEKLNKGEDILPDLQKPKGAVPNKIRDILKTLIRNAIRSEVDLTALREQKEFISKKLPSNALIGRLEAIIKNKSQSEFAEDLDEVKKRKPARDALERCIDKEQTLLEFLTEKKVSVQSILKKASNGNIVNLCGEIDYAPESDDELSGELYQKYFSTFFSSMRKRAKKEKGD